MYAHMRVYIYVCKFVLYMCAGVECVYIHMCVYMCIRSCMYVQVCLGNGCKYECGMCVCLLERSLRVDGYTRAVNKLASP